MIGSYVSSVHRGAFGNMYAAKATSDKLKSIISRLVFPLQHREVYMKCELCKKPVTQQDLSSTALIQQRKTNKLSS